ncbi:MAG: hypothetical protein K6E79_05975 [Pseudobutyrivibrio sp.]|nr:hypothetical protein [Pseudobutyrivibrio sp.]
MFTSSKKWFVSMLIILCLVLVTMASVIIVVDPYFHYHKPLAGLYYELNNERSQNDGIIRHFDYDAIITGTSMAENFKTSEMDDIFGTNSIKVTFAGGSYNEINENLEKALKLHPEVKTVVRPLDYSYLMDPVDRTREDLGTYPDYLYDDNPFNDVNYFFNKEILFDICLPMIEDAMAGKPGGITSFDDYSNWMDTAEFGPAAALGDRTSFSEPTTKEPFVDELKEATKENITKNVIELAQANPDVQFYYYFTPYSVAWWGGVYEEGTMYRWIAAEQYAIELMLECDNIHLYSFNTEFDLTTDLNNYSDECHHGDWINSQILGWLYSGNYLLTKDNYMEYINEETQYYESFDYNSLFE